MLWFDICNNGVKPKAAIHLSCYLYLSNTKMSEMDNFLYLKTMITPYLDCTNCVLMLQ